MALARQFIDFFSLLWFYLHVLIIVKAPEGKNRHLQYTEGNKIPTKIFSSMFLNRKAFLNVEENVFNFIKLLHLTYVAIVLSLDWKGPDALL